MTRDCVKEAKSYSIKGNVIQATNAPRPVTGIRPVTKTASSPPTNSSAMAIIRFQ